jgi:histone deacetylase 11
MNAELVYSPSYDLALPGLSWVHPFDGRKFSRAWEVLRSRLGDALEGRRLAPDAPVPDASLLRVHTAAYLDSLRSSAVVAKALEAWPLRFLPRAFLQNRILAPMRWATAGTILAAARALERGGMVMNVGGGFHHAFPDRGEGFCLFADAAVAIAEARARGLLGAGDRVIMIDLDAHRGNGFEACLGADPAVRILDIYNAQAYPGLHPGHPDKFPYMIPMRAGLSDEGYLSGVREELPPFLEAAGPIRLAFYNAGTDILAGDRIGGLAVSADGIRERDRYVVDLLAERKIPTVIVTSGGYTKSSFGLVADLAFRVLALDPVAPPKS